MKSFCCPLCSTNKYTSSTLHDGSEVRSCANPFCPIKWVSTNDNLYLRKEGISIISKDPECPTYDEIMTAAPGWEIAALRYAISGEQYVWKRGSNVFVSLVGPSSISSGEVYVLKKCSDWKYFQKDFAEKWLKENYPDKKIIGLKKLSNSGQSYIVKREENFDGISDDVVSRVGIWRWIIESKENNITNKKEYSDKELLDWTVAHPIESMDAINELWTKCKNTKDLFSFRTAIINEINKIPKHPSIDEIMTAAPGWQLDVFRTASFGDTYFEHGTIYKWLNNKTESDHPVWILCKGPDWDYYQKENAKKWLNENYPDMRLVGLRKLNDFKNTLNKRRYIVLRSLDHVFGGVALIPTDCSDSWRWIVEPKEKEYKLGNLGISKGYYIDDNNNKIALSCILQKELGGFIFPDGSIESDYKRLKNGSIEWAVAVKIKET